MDISVSRLNNRMALQLPAELPLGLVFVVGDVQQLRGGENTRTNFYLGEGGALLHCRLSERASQEVKLMDGVRIRAGGHLAFDPQRAEYYLLARDVEVIGKADVDASTLRKPVAPILADITKRAKAAALTPATLPPWVKDMAPPELQSHLTETEVEAADFNPELDEIERTIGAWTTADDHENANGPGQQADTFTLSPTPATSDELNTEMITFLSAAMDQDDEVELTTELLTELTPQIKPEKSRFQVAQPYDLSHSEPGRIHWAIATAVLFILLLVLLFIAYLIISGGLI